ncbi:MAG: DUF2508 family protein [Alkaliphilus sp.]
MKREGNISGRKLGVFSGISGSIELLYNRMFEVNEDEIGARDTCASLVHKAHEEWQNAEKFFHSVSDPDLIDYAVYNLDAAKSRYIYLLKKVKEERG